LAVTSLDYINETKYIATFIIILNNMDMDATVD